MRWNEIANLLEDAELATRWLGLGFFFTPAEWQVQTQSGQRFFNSCGMLVNRINRIRRMVKLWLLRKSLDPSQTLVIGAELLFHVQRMNNGKSVARAQTSSERSDVELVEADGASR